MNLAELHQLIVLLKKIDNVRPALMLEILDVIWAVEGMICEKQLEQEKTRSAESACKASEQLSDDAQARREARRIRDAVEFKEDNE